jgi:polyferredoxin
MKKWIQPLRFIVQAFFAASLFLPLIHSETVAHWLFWSVVFIGVFFCGWVCPFGTAQEWLGIIAERCKIPRLKMPKYIQRYLQFSRYIFFGLMVFGISFSFSGARFYFQDNLVYNMLTLTGAVVLASFLIISLFFERPFCNYFCTKGAADGLMSMVRIAGISREDKTCIHCRLCDKICPMNISVEQTKFVRHPNCINCMKCMGVCPKNCIKFKLMNIPKFKDRLNDENKFCS